MHRPHLALLLGVLQVLVNTIEAPDPVVGQPGNEDCDETKGEAISGPGGSMTVGPAAFAVECQQTHHEHPQVG